MFFRKWLTFKESPSIVAKEIAESLRTDRLISRRIDALGVSEIGVMYLGGKVSVSVYAARHGFRLRDISIHGKQSIAHGVDADHIHEAAVERIQKLMAEDLAELNALRLVGNK